MLKVKNSSSGSFPDHRKQSTKLNAGQRADNHHVKTKTF